MTVFDAATNVPIMVISVGNGNDNLGLAISPDGRLVYVANQSSGTVTVIATATNTVVQTISTGLEPIWITFSANGSRAYVSNQLSGIPPMAKRTASFSDALRAAIMTRPVCSARPNNSELSSLASSICP